MLWFLRFWFCTNALVFCTNALALVTIRKFTICSYCHCHSGEEAVCSQLEKPELHTAIQGAPHSQKCCKSFARMLWFLRFWFCTNALVFCTNALALVTIRKFTICSYCHCHSGEEALCSQLEKPELHTAMPGVLHSQKILYVFGKNPLVFKQNPSKIHKYPFSAKMAYSFLNE